MCEEKKEYRIVSTSRRTGEVDIQVLEKSDLIRMLVKPTLVDNPKDPQKSLSIKLIYEKKSKNDAKFPSEIEGEKLSKKSVKKGEWMELSLRTEATYKLYTKLCDLYSIYAETNGVPYGESKFSRTDGLQKNLLDVLRGDPVTARAFMAHNNYELVKQFLTVIAHPAANKSAAKILSAIEKSNLDAMTESLNLEQLRRASNYIATHMDDSKEEAWQKYFENNSWILSQIFYTPCSLMDSKAYVGGKMIDNKGGNICDFLYQNKLTNSVSLIEIKTPNTPLVGHEYRNTYSLSHEISGAINQVLNYKDSVQKSFHMLNGDANAKFEVFNPMCVVIAGKIDGMTQDKVKAFECFRNNISSVVIITFDELLQKIKDLVSLLSHNTTAKSEL